LASTDGEEQRRIREALEEYGFVARQNAAVLLAADPYDRTSAARMLGDIQSQSALPFLLEHFMTANRSSESGSFEYR